MGGECGCGGGVQLGVVMACVHRRRRGALGIVKVARNGGLCGIAGVSAAFYGATGALQAAYVEVAVAGVEEELGLVERGARQARKLRELLLLRGCRQLRGLARLLRPVRGCWRTCHGCRVSGKKWSDANFRQVPASLALPAPYSLPAAQMSNILALGPRLTTPVSPRRTTENERVPD